MLEAPLRVGRVRQQGPLPIPFGGFALGFCIVAVLSFVMSSGFENGFFWVAQNLRLF